MYGAVMMWQRGCYVLLTLLGVRRCPALNLDFCLALKTCFLPAVCELLRYEGKAVYAHSAWLLLSIKVRSCLHGCPVPFQRLCRPLGAGMERQLPFTVSHFVWEHATFPEFPVILGDSCKWPLLAVVTRVS